MQEKIISTQTVQPAASGEPAQHGLTEHSHGPGSPVPQQSRAERPKSFDLADFPMPTGREEEWRFTPMDVVAGALTDQATEDGEGDDHAASYELELPEGVESSTLQAGEGPRGSVLVPADRAAVVAHLGTRDALYVRIPADAEYAEPLREIVTGTPGRRQNAHYVIEAGAHSKAVYVLDHRGGGVHTGNLEVIVGDGADLTVVSIQQWDDDAVHLGQHDARVGRDARYKHVAVTLGGSAVRLNVNATYDGPGGSATLLGLYFADAGQHLEHRSFVDHGAPALHAARSPTRARCRATPPTRSGWVTSSSAPAPRAPTPTS